MQLSTGSTAITINIDVDNPFESPVIISYCTGIRGLERGLERAIGSVRTAAYLEIEAFIIENLLAGMQAGVLAPAPIWANLKTFDALPFRGRIHGIIGGYPCQPFSNAGKRQGTEDPRHLWPYLERDIKAARPVWCFFENVSGHLTLGFDTVYRSLSDMGYAVEAGIFTAEEVGAPHERERLFILAVSKDFLGNADCAADRHNQCGVHAETTPAGTELGNANVRNGFDLRGQKSRESQFNGIDDTGNELAHAHNRRGEQCNENIGDIQFFDEGGNEVADTGLQRQAERQEQAAGVEQCSEARSMADTNSHRQTTPKHEDIAGRPQINIRHEELAFNWPARPGQRQYDWEEPRTIKPRMGCTINGYNFREDLLRAYGNGVVEQTAEIAFPTLLQKHLDNARTKTR